ncbi:hypothetical protein PHYPO_G00208160 [Pangasianodon hypophthalmus]|uniref:Uncharacterized protein n=2 Tax=Pangasianodon TaxID=30992 RepID=A0A5N5PDD0_PANHP|nr:hypothetical protein PHYPO_G00208160 [Pangasianodon hypophthalmus]MCI4378670.1 hypothetical protein [Pangasianodon gigas]
MLGGDDDAAHHVTPRRHSHACRRQQAVGRRRRGAERRGECLHHQQHGAPGALRSLTARLHTLSAKTTAQTHTCRLCHPTG